MWQAGKLNHRRPQPLSVEDIGDSESMETEACDPTLSLPIADAFLDTYSATVISTHDTDSAETLPLPGALVKRSF